MRLRFGRLLAATALVAGVGLAVPAPAQAATCSSDTGVSVVVDFSGAGDGGIQSACVVDGGGDTANSLFGAAEHTLTRVQSQPGAVCKVDGVREADQCAQMPPTNAYWGIFWSDGSGGWIYSTEGVDSLNVPDGGSVAFAWQDGGSYNYPGIAAPQHQEEPQPSQKPQPSSSPGSGSGGGGGGSGSTSGPGTSPSTAPGTSERSGTDGPSGQPSPSEQREREGGGDGAGSPVEKAEEEQKKDARKDRKSPRDDESTAATPDAETDAAPTASPPVVEEDGLPTWVAPAAVGALFTLAGVVALLRRRSTG